MGGAIDLITTLVCLISVLVTLGHDGYLFMLGSAAKKRAGGEPVGRMVRGRWPVALVATIAALLGWAISGGGIGWDIVGGAVAVISAYASVKALQTTKKKFLAGPGYPQLPQS
jgi:hypothetical protein